jgi:glycosyltransferase involved in cell wall biosynthesis
MFLDRVVTQFRRGARPAGDDYESDVCLILEGCYPYVSGGVSAWTHGLIRQQGDLRFSVISILPRAENLQPKYELPGNVVRHHHLYLHRPERPSTKMPTAAMVERLTEALLDITHNRSGDGLRGLIELIGRPNDPLDLDDLLNSPLAWEVTSEMYRRTMPYGSFLHYFWAWRSLFGGLFATLKLPLPKARAYHTMSTGYAGILAARAKIETGRPALITEHGIYTNERRVEVLMADWIADMLDKGLSLSDTRYDLRDMWTNTFEQYARVCYEACDRIVTLYEDNQKQQLELGADPDRMEVIPNGVDPRRFAYLARPEQEDPPTIALIGRVVPIKDIKTFINAAAVLRKKFPQLKALVIGPTDEDPAYHRECRALVRRLKLNDTVHFTGMARIEDYLPQIHVNVLTSMSEAQPLAVLEAGAAGIPCVATDVGSCRAILLGRDDEDPRLGPGGIITDLVSPADTARAIETLLVDPAKREQYGRALRARVARYYDIDKVGQAYAELYRRYCFRLPAAELQRSAG